MELHASGKYTADNGFKPGYFQAMQNLLDVSLPESELKADPHIKSRLKTLKGNFCIVHDMLIGTNTSGFGWDPVKCCITADDQVWEDYNKAHKGTRQFKGKSFPFYEKLSIIFGKDRATGARAIDLGDDDVQVSNEPVDVEDLDIDRDVPMTQEGNQSMTSKRKRGKSLDFDRTYMESAMMLNNSFTTFGNTLSTDMRALVNDETSSVELMRKVVKELEGLTRNNPRRAYYGNGCDWQ